jgi:tetratricopeptide (TPR) repeat protein
MTAAASVERDDRDIVSLLWVGGRLAVAAGGILSGGRREEKKSRSRALRSILGSIGSMLMSTTSISRPSLRARRLALLSALVLFAAGTSSVVGQDATFQGKVLDPKGKGVEGATVTLVKADDPAVTASATTDKKGVYKLAISTPGDFSLRAEKAGFGQGERPVKVELGMLYNDADVQLLDEKLWKENQAVEAFNAGVKSLQAGKPEEAVTSFQKASELNPELPQTQYALAAALHGLKRWEEAAAAIDRYKQMQPADDRPELNQLSFELYFEAGQEEKAKAALAKITDPKARAELAPRVYNAGVAKTKAEDLEGAIARFELAAELDPSFAQAHQNIAAIEFNRQRFKEALPHLDKLLAAKADSVEGLRMRFFSLRALGDDRMKDALRDYLAKAPAAGEEIAKIAGDDFDAGNADLATKTLEALIELKPDVAVAHYHLGRALASAGANAGAKTHLQHFVEMAPNHPDAKAAKQMMAEL